jgi:hypothetical protein
MKVRRNMQKPVLAALAALAVAGAGAGAVPL